MVKCGIIGCGVIAPTHIEGYQRLDNACVVHISDLIPERMTALGDKYGIAKRSQDYRDLLADPEVELVSVCTDHASHAQIVKDVLEAGKHVICEKSAARVPEDIHTMLNAAKAHPELVASGIFQHRFETHNIVLRDMLNSGKFGKLLAVNLHFCCRRTADYYIKDAWRGTFAGEGGGVLINQAIHHLDQLRFLFGDIEAVTAKTANLTHQGVIEVEDTAFFLLEFTSGVNAVVMATNSSVRNWNSKLMVEGELASLFYENEKCSSVEALTPELAKEIEDALSDEREKATVSGKSYYGSGHTNQLADVVNAIEEGRKPFVTLEEACMSSLMVLSVYESAKSGCRVKTSDLL